MLAIYYIWIFSILEKTPLLFPFPFVGLHNLSVKQNQNCLLAASVPPPGNKPPSSGWVCRPHTAVTAGHLPRLLSPISPSAFLAPPFPSSSFCTALLASLLKGSRAVLMRFCSLFSKYSEEVTSTLSQDMQFTEEFLLRNWTSHSEHFAGVFLGGMGSIRV